MDRKGTGWVKSRNNAIHPFVVSHGPKAPHRAQTMQFPLVCAISGEKRVVRKIVEIVPTRNVECYNQAAPQLIVAAFAVLERKMQRKNAVL